MDPRKLFSDDRLKGFCVYCGGTPGTRDHVPSRILLDDPFPQNLPVVECCRACNEGFSLDEEYVACFIECVLSGSIARETFKRPKIARILGDNPTLASRIDSTVSVGAKREKIWEPEHKRVRNVIVKLARGHIAYELGLPRLEEPEVVRYVPINLMSAENVNLFLGPQSTPFLPEIGSRSFIRVVTSGGSSSDDWQVIQPGRYQYLVSQAHGDFVRILLSNYLACEVYWD